MKYILGLDVGTNSLGWYLLKSDSKYQIVDRGIIIFPIGTIVDPVKGLEKTKHAQRRGFRLLARTLFRKKLRKWRLAKLLKNAGLYPERLEDKDFHFEDTFKVKNRYQSLELYELRTKALSHAVKPEEIGRLFFLLNNYRGFKSSSKSVSDQVDGKNDEDGKVKGAIETLNGLMRNANAATYGEYFYKMHLKAQQLYKEGKWHNPNELIDERAFNENGNIVLTRSYGIRRENGRYTSRKVYENEFDLIWSEQKKHYKNLLTGSKEEYDGLQEKLYLLSKQQRRHLVNEFKQTLYWQIKYECIYYQRPLKSAKRYINKCPFEKNKRTAPVSSYLFQSFRIWKQLADIRYSNGVPNVINEPLTLEWRKAIFEYLQTNSVVYLKSGKNKTGICELLDLNEKLTTFNFDNEENDKYIKGNTTHTALFNVLGQETYNILKNDCDRNGSSRLDKLWHLLYMKKDDEWLKITLSDSVEWKYITPNKVQKLVEMTLEEGYASYSSKMIKKILPFMEEGEDEHSALQKAGYKELDQTFDEATWVPQPKIIPVKSNELRNPVVEKSINETIGLINSILEKYPEIDRRTWEVHIETTRELKKPKKEREKMRRENTSKDELRQEYARFLNEQRENGKLTGIIKSEVFKNSPIIGKFELWLEMGGDKEDPEFEAFINITKLDFEKRIKHKLWLECNRVCPYSGKIISLKQLFSPDTEIEHIIPLSRSLDDSFANRTLTFHHINKEKGNMTALEYIDGRKDTFRRRILAGSFSKEKKNNFLKEKVPLDFTHAQISNTSYIAKFTRKKIQEVCKPHLVYFTNGKVTAELRNNDWRLSNLVDKIRFEESTGLDVDSFLKRFNILKKYFHSFYKLQMGNDIKLPKSATDFNQIPDTLLKAFDEQTGDNLIEVLKDIQQFEAFRGAKGKKDRSDHRHHSLDALIISLCSPIITKSLSTLNASREKFGISLYENGELTRDKIDLPLSYFDIKESLKNILVVNKINQRLIVAKKNKIKTGDGIVIHPSKSVRSSLHKDTYYGKLQEPALLGISKPEAYITRFNNYIWNFDDPDKLDSIYDTDLREIVKRRINWFKQQKIAINKESYEKYPLYRYSPKVHPLEEPSKPVSNKTGKPLPVVKKIRTLYKNYRSIIELPKNKYADNDSNYIMAFYELKEKGKKGLKDFRLLSAYEAVIARNEKRDLFNDEINKNGKFLSLSEDCPFLKSGDLVILYQDEIDKISLDWKDNEGLKKRLYKVVMLSSEEKYGIVSFLNHNISSHRISYLKGAFEKEKIQNAMTMRHTQIKAIKVCLDNLGRIRRSIKQSL